MIYNIFVNINIFHNHNMNDCARVFSYILKDQNVTQWHLKYGYYFSII